MPTNECTLQKWARPFLKVIQDVLFERDDKMMRYAFALLFATFWVFGICVVIPFARGGGFSAPAEASSLVRLAHLVIMIGLIFMFSGWPGWLLGMWDQRFKRIGKVSEFLVCAGAIVATLGTIITKLN